MTRPPLARGRVLEAARRIVRARGARGLTLQRIAQESGVTRGGILYHWPTRKALLHALIDYDLDSWERRCRDYAPGPAADVAGHVHCGLDPAHGDGELAAGLLAELRDDPVARNRVERFAMRQLNGWCWDDDDLARYLLVLAAEGAFWRRVHGLTPPVDGLDSRLRALIDTMLAALDGRAPATAAAGTEAGAATRAAH